MTKIRNSGGRRGRKDTVPLIVEGEVTASITGARKKQTQDSDVRDTARTKPAPQDTTGVPDVIVPLRHRHDGWTPIR